MFLISHTFTRPLASLVAGVRALEKGDFSYPLESSGGDEVAEVTGAFPRMRSSLERRKRSRSNSKSGFARRTRWRRSAGWPAGWRTTSIIC